MIVSALKKALALVFISEFFLRFPFKFENGISRKRIQKSINTFNFSDLELDLASKMATLSHEEKSSLINILDIKVKTFSNQLIDFIDNKFRPPCPNVIKWETLLRHAPSNATWVETGTHIALTTEVLSKNSKAVFTIEPSEHFFELARKKFHDVSRVTVLHGVSEEILPKLLPTISGDVAFWLDGHYSAGNTFKGSKDTPIVEELEAISKNIDRFTNITILIDDVRCFDPANEEYASYPSLDYLVDWARERQLKWLIEYDIFIAKKL